MAGATRHHDHGASRLAHEAPGDAPDHDGVCRAVAARAEEQEIELLGRLGEDVRRVADRELGLDPGSASMLATAASSSPAARSCNESLYEATPPTNTLSGGVSKASGVKARITRSRAPVATARRCAVSSACAADSEAS